MPVLNRVPGLRLGAQQIARTYYGGHLMWPPGGDGSGSSVSVEQITTTAVTGFTTAHTVNFGATVAGETLVVVLSFSANSPDLLRTEFVPDYLSVVADASGQSSQMWVLAGVVPEDAPTSANFFVSNSCRSAATVYRLSGADGVEAANTYVGTGEANPPALTPTFGNAALWIAAAHSAGGENRYGASGAVPEGYEGESVIATAASDVSAWHMMHVTAHKSESAASEDPGAFTFASRSGAWVATVGVKAA